MEHELDREQQERAEIARRTVEFLENEIWTKATDAQKLRLCQLFATLTAMRMPEIILTVIPAKDGQEDTSVPRKSYRFVGKELVPVR
jgi:hypothetical protein